MASKLAQHALHCELVEVGLDNEVDGVGEREASWKLLTVYEMDNADQATDSTYDKSNHIDMTGPMSNARFDVRTYEEVKRWQQVDWDGNHADIVSVAVMEWQVAEGDEKEILDFYQTVAAPTIASSPDCLRFRMFKIKNATVLKAGSYETLEKEKLHTYLTLAELETEEWPWDVVIALGEKPKWREYFEGQKFVRWQSSHYLVKRSYPEDVDD
ncbi:uncharacterized protein M421DRAFT_422183 [Didymella exigua CBS 183.55]|uniref:Uncharacterized protein n=1 Tax=Didymella exigua CBS 183.55 TaxID=1150837 RepID=A0A6A5RI79_9PLEO|nr:uncharacterized protein M421DRAFT_422183 [Didymella exigua CBS 183.55]KAF1926950.1 hypothetical protein M421DRAFT_422183 [Didymella exigua CBS 183.55]